MENEKKAVSKRVAPPGNRTRVARMGILHDTTTPAVLTWVSVYNGLYNTPRMR